MPVEWNKSDFRNFLTLQQIAPELMLECFQKKSDQIFAIGNTYVILGNPKIIKHIFLTDASHYTKIFKSREVIGKYGPMSPKIWEHDRKIIVSQFSNEKMRDYVTTVTALVTGQFKNLELFCEENTPIQIDNFFTKLTLANLLNTVFGNVTIDKSKVISMLRELLSLSSPLNLARMKIFGIPTFNYFKYKNLEKNFKKIGLSIVEQSFSENTNKDNLIQHLANAYNFNSFSKLNTEMKEHLVGTAFQFLIAGYEAVSALATRVFMLLSLQPIIADKVREELKSLLNGRNPNYEDLQKLSYMRAFIQETLRLYPPFTNVVRNCIEDNNIEEYQFKKGDRIIVPVNINQRLAKYWKNPEGFDPNRFLQPLAPDQKLLYMPFGLGPRACIGAHFAISQVMAIVATLCQHYSFEASPGISLKREPGFVNRLNQDITMKICKIPQTEAGLP